MSPRLLDVNVLIALAWPNHMHHQAAHRWFAELGSSLWATCAITQCGFIRVSSNAKFIPNAVSPHQAAKVLSVMAEDRRHVFLPSDVSWADAEFSDLNVVGHQQVTDAYLLALARRHSGLVATFDQAMTSLAGRDAAKHVALIS